MPLKPWYKIATPKEDLREGKPLDASEFAIHLDQVIEDRAPFYFATSINAYDIEISEDVFLIPKEKAQSIQSGQNQWSVASDQWSEEDELLYQSSF